MNKIKKALLSTSKNLAISSLKRDANSTTCTAIYQPKAPASLDKFKKHID
ncbi:MAG: cyclic lactone autoinducer peptide [Eubacterium sp.]|nr:cyclic lactone autoinducer peptide [Ruminococcus bromii]MEE0007037.1 cyclic lactone autoinducer peptide [Ruminococcus bromii]